MFIIGLQINNNLNLRIIKKKLIELNKFSLFRNKMTLTQIVIIKVLKKKIFGINILKIIFLKPKA